MSGLALDDGAGAAGEGELELFRGGDDAEFFLAGEVRGGLDFWEHGTGGEVAGGDVVVDFARREEAESDLVGTAEVDVGVRDGGDGNENVGLDKLGELLGGKIFVDDSVDTLQNLEDFGAGDGDAATADSNDDSSRIDESGDFFTFDDIERLRGRDDTAITATSVFFHFPTFELGEFDGFFCSIELTDRFRWVFEGGVGFIDDDLSDDADDFFMAMFPSEGVADGLRKPIADLALAHGDCGFERHGWGGRRSGRLFVNENVADLRAVAVGDDNFVFVRKARDCAADLFGDGFLGFGSHFPVFLESVAAKSDNYARFLHIKSIR